MSQNKQNKVYVIVIVLLVAVIGLLYFGEESPTRGSQTIGGEAGRASASGSASLPQWSGTGHVLGSGILGKTKNRIDSE